jgi:hypothetical protein
MSRTATLGRIVVALVVLWFLIGLAAFILFASAGSTPPESGQGTEISP